LGRLTAIKRPDRVIELANSMPQIKFAIGGEGELSDEIKANAPRNLVVLGWISPEDFWPACDVALLTSDNEGLPTSLIEAAFSMKPIVSEDVGSASEIFEDRKGGFLVSDFETRRRAVISLTGERELALKMGRNAQEYALKKFSIEKFVNMHMQAYSQA
jgi:glycosyltransferase involved in cell wall biosynthesis